MWAALSHNSLLLSHFQSDSTDKNLDIFSLFPPCSWFKSGIASGCIQLSLVQYGHNLLRQSLLLSRSINTTKGLAWPDQISDQRRDNFLVQPLNLKRRLQKCNDEIGGEKSWQIRFILDPLMLPVTTAKVHSLDFDINLFREGFSICFARKKLVK